MKSIHQVSLFQVLERVQEILVYGLFQALRSLKQFMNLNILSINIGGLKFAKVKVI